MSLSCFLKAVVFGVMAAVLGSAIIAFAFAVVVGYALHPFDGWSWLFEVSVVPSVMGTLVIGRLARTSAPTRRRAVVAALTVAFAAVALAGSMGAITVGTLRFGLGSVNAVGYLQWCGVYALGLLPVSFPIARAAVWGLWGKAS